MTTTVIIEYSIQNSFAKQIAHSQTPSVFQQETYPNVYILPKRYPSLRDVRLSEVINAFPLANDTNYKYNFLFETSLTLGKKNNVKVWVDAPPNLECGVPNVDGKIKMKVLQVPIYAQKV